MKTNVMVKQEYFHSEIQKSWEMYCALSIYLIPSPCYPKTTMIHGQSMVWIVFSSLDPIKFQE